MDACNRASGWAQVSKAICMSLCPAWMQPFCPWGACTIGQLVCSGRAAELAQPRQAGFVKWRWISSQSDHHTAQRKRFTAMVFYERAPVSQRHDNNRCHSSWVRITDSTEDRCSTGAHLAGPGAGAVKPNVTAAFVPHAGWLERWAVECRIHRPVRANGPTRTACHRAGERPNADPTHLSAPTASHGCAGCSNPSTQMHCFHGLTTDRRRFRVTR